MGSSTGLAATGFYWECRDGVWAALEFTNFWFLSTAHPQPRTEEGTAPSQAGSWKNRLGTCLGSPHGAAGLRRRRIHPGKDGRTEGEQESRGRHSRGSALFITTAALQEKPGSAGTGIPRR